MNQEDCALIVAWSSNEDPPAANVLWIWNQFHLAKTLDDLEQVVIDLKNDQFENEPYTKDDAVMAVMRRTYVSQLERIENPDQEIERVT